MNILVSFILCPLLHLTYSLPQSSPSLDQSEECSTYESAGYHCVPYFQCRKNGTIVMDGSDIFDPRFSDDAKVFCPNHEKTLQTACDELLQVCCLHPEIEQTRRCLTCSKGENCDEYPDDYYNYQDYNGYNDYDETPKTSGGCNENIKFDIREDKNTIFDCNKTVKCEDYKDQGYSCAPYYQCMDKDRNPEIISDGFGLIDLRSSDISSNCVFESDVTLDASDDKCPGANQVCCKNADKSVKICGPVASDNYNECGRINSPRTRDSRGVTITNLNTKVSKSAQPGEFPHMCIIYRVNNGLTTYVGGASLLARNKVLSVAHKFHVITRRETVDLRKDMESLRVRCGEYNVKLKTELQKAQESPVEQLYFHPLYDPNNQFVPNDLVILRTKENFIYQEHIGPVCLPRPEDKFDTSVDQCWSSGWGADQFGAVGKFQDIMKKVAMNVISDDECNQRLGLTRLKNRYKVHKSHLCVGGERGIDTCTGDGGSPHVCKRDGKWVQVGAVAWGIGCNDGIPSVYSSVPDAMCWIDWIMTCLPLAVNDTSLNQDPDSERSADTEPNSVNKLSVQDCGSWASANEALINVCDVIYVTGENDYDYDIRITE